MGQKTLHVYHSLIFRQNAFIFDEHMSYRDTLLHTKAGCCIVNCILMIEKKPKFSILTHLTLQAGKMGQS